MVSDMAPRGLGIMKKDRILKYFQTQFILCSKFQKGLNLTFFTRNYLMVVYINNHRGAHLNALIKGYITTSGRLQECTSAQEEILAPYDMASTLCSGTLNLPVQR